MKSSLPAFVIACAFSFQVDAQTTYIWKPQGASTSAKVISNWKVATCNGSTATVFPGSSDTLLFSNCSGTNVIIDTPMNVRFVNVKSNYTGTITLSGSNTFTADKMRVTGGTFSGGSGTLNISSSLSIDGGTFTSTSATFTLAGNFSKSSGTFNHNNGTVVFKKAASGQPTISGSSITSAVDFYDVIFDAPDATTSFSISSIYFAVNHSMTITGDEQLFINGDTILMAGSSNLTLSNTSGTGGGTADIKFNSSSTQTITGNSGTDYTKLPNVIIAKSGTLNLSGNIGMGGTTYLDYRSGTISEGTSSLLFYHDNTIKGKMEFYNVEFQGHSSSHYLTDTIVINNNLVMTGTATNTVNNGAINLNQNLTYTNSHSSSILNSTIQFTNFSQDQLITGSSLARAYDIKIESGHTLVLQNPMIISHSLTLTSGFIKSTATNLLTLTSGCTVSGGSSSSFLKGPVKKVGNSSFTFPLGAGSSYKPLTISAPSSSTDAFTAEFFGVIQPLGLARSSLTYTSMCEYWNLARTTGSSNVTVRLSWDSHSCDIYTLGTLKIGRWNGSAWADVGSVTTSGNTTAGTITTSSSQSSFGDFLIAKNSPAVTANAGSNPTISLGQSTTLGGSPSASSGTSPYTYEWLPDYALSSNTSANPSAQPFATHQYYLRVTDTDFMYDVDTVKVIVNGFDLKSLKRFPLLADGDIDVFSPVTVVGAVGSNNNVDADVTATDEIFLSTSEVTLALLHLDTVMAVIDGLSASSISGSLGSHSYTTGVYRITGNATLSGTLTLDGDENSYFVFDINGALAIANGASIVLDGVTKQQVYFRVQDDIYIPSGSATLNGYFFGSEDFLGTISGGNVSINVKGEIDGGFPPMYNLLIASLTQDPRTIDHFIGYNGTNTIKAEFGWGNVVSGDGFPLKMPILSPGLLRYPGGTVSNWWNWPTGWFRGYDNPFHNNDLGYNVKDEYPLPVYATDGLPWDNNAAKPLPDKLEDFKDVLDACAAFPILNLNLLTSDMGTQIGELFNTRCLDIPTKYIELGNEFYLNGDESAAAFPMPVDYGIVADFWAQQIKEIIPDVKIAAVASFSKTNITNPPDRRNYWNLSITDPNTGIAGLFSSGDLTHIDALTFHIYPWIGLKDPLSINTYSQPNIDHASYSGLYDGDDGMFANILAEPFRLEADLEVWESGESQPEFDADGQSGISDKDIWITEYNQEEDFYNFRGRWLHSLFTAGMTLGFLSNPKVTHVTCQTSFSDADQGAYFQDVQGYPPGEGYPDPVASPTITWELAATGYGLKYLGAAMKNTYYADKIIIGPGVPLIKDILGETHEGIVGWMFSDGENFTLLDSLLAVFINFTDNKRVLSVADIFPLGGEYWEMTTYVSESTKYDDARMFLLGGESIESEATDIVGGEITLKPYTIFLIRGKKAGNPCIGSTIHAESSNNSICSGGTNEATIYVSGSTKYYINPAAANGLSIVIGPTITVSPTGTTTYFISGTDGQLNWNQQPVEIEVSQMPSFTAELMTCDIKPCPHCPGDNVTIVLESSTPDLKYNWYPRSEDDELYEVSSTVFNLTVHPQVSGQYTINASDGICFCSQQTVLMEVTEPVDAGPDVWICDDFADDDEVEIGYLPDDNLGFHIYQWTPSTGLFDDEASLTAFTGLPSTTTTYLLEDVNYYCPSEDEVTVHVVNCCNGDDPDFVFDPFDPTYTQGNYLTAWDFAERVCSTNTCTYNDLGTPLYSLDDEYEIVTSDEIVINGPFYINLNLSLKDCENIYFGPEAEIIIEPNSQLVLNRKTFLQAGCDQMWKGITLEGNLREDDGIVLITNTAYKPLIKDAEIGIKATKDSRIKITTGDFQNNYEHITISDYVFSLNHFIKNADFTSNSGTMLSPHENEQTAIAIKLNDVPSTGDNNNDALIADNDIDHADFGIDALFTGLVVSGKTALIQHSIEDVGTGIRSDDAQEYQSIKNYVLDGCDNGIVLNKTNGYKSEVSNNTITMNALSTNPAGEGIRVTDIGDVDLIIGGESSGFANVIYSNALHGIYISGFNGGTIQHNNIHLPLAAGSLVYGIKGDNLPTQTNFYSNSIDVSGASAIVTNTRGISLSDVINYEVKCNIMDYNEFGLQFINSCITDGKLKVEWNYFNNLDQALVLGENNILTPTATSDFGNPSTSTSNYFSGLSTYFDLYSINTNTDLIKYYVTSSVTDPTTSGTIGGTSMGFGNSNSADADGCSALLQEDETDYDLYLAIINESFDISEEFKPIFYFNLKSSLFEKLKYDEELRSDRSEFEEFYDTVKNQTIGLFSLVEEYINESCNTLLSSSERNSWIDLAISTNEIVAPDFDYEVNKQTINNIYLNTVCKHIFEFDEYQWNLIDSISHLCPFISGDAVFHARNLFRIKINNIPFNDSYLCLIEPPRISFESVLPKFSIFPNPTTDKVFVNFKNLDTEQTCYVSVVDLLGKKLVTSTIKAREGQMTLDCSKFASGIYFVSVEAGTLSIWGSKFIKMK